MRELGGGRAERTGLSGLGDLRWGCVAQLSQPPCPLGLVLQTLPPPPPSKRKACGRGRRSTWLLGSRRCPWVPSCDPSAFSWIWASEGTWVLTIICDRWMLSPTRAFHTLLLHFHYQSSFPGFLLSPSALKRKKSFYLFVSCAVWE